MLNRKVMKCHTYAGCALLLTLATGLQAEETSEHHSEEPGNTIGVFLGDTTEDRRDGFTLGVEYEYRVSRAFGIGAIYEHVAGSFDTDIVVLPFAAHRGPWKAYVGPGIEFSEEGEEPLVRVGLESGFHVDDFEISPQIDLDFVDGDRLFVFGIVVAKEL